MTNPATHLAQAIAHMGREPEEHVPSKREVDAIYDDLIARLADTLATLSSDDVDTTPQSFRAGSVRPRITRS